MQSSAPQAASAPVQPTLAFDTIEAARLASVSPSTIRRAIASGGLKPVRFGRAVRITRDSLSEWLLANTVDTSSTVVERLEVKGG